VNPLLNSTLSANKAVVAAMNGNLRNQSGPTAYQLTSHDLGVLSRFYDRTALTVGQGNTRYIYQKEGFKLAMRVSCGLSFVLVVKANIRIALLSNAYCPHLDDDA
jgi:hypothetical protein